MKKSRKRLLISSVAMLLVAMLALGTATFAWFTTSTSTKADGINVTTVKSSDLKISRYNHTWVDGFSYGHTSDTYKPTSSLDGVAWYTAVAEKKNEFTKKTGTDFASAGTMTLSVDGGIANYVYVEELNVKNEGDVTATNVQIEISGTFSDYVRVALVPCDSNHTMTGTFADCVYGKDTTSYTPAPATVPQGQSEAPTITPKTTRTITPTPVGSGKTAGVFEKDDAAYFRVYVWFEGQDTDCYDNNGGQNLPDLQFKVTGTTSQS